MTYTDRTLACVDCGGEFIHSAADQEYHVQKAFTSDPKRCGSCRAGRRHEAASGQGPAGGREREVFAAVCSRCGNQAQVPFRPRSDRPIYCSDCFREVKPG